MTEWKLLAGGIVFVLYSLALYATIRFNKGKISNLGDMFFFFGACFAFLGIDYVILFHYTWYVYTALTMGIGLGLLITVAPKHMDSKSNDEKWWFIPLAFILFTVMFPICIPFIACFLYFKLDEKH